jgi:signal transduction histidine kinase
MFFERLKSALRRLSVRLTLWHSLLFMGSALVLLALTYVLLENRARDTEHYVVESRMNQYVSEYRRSGLEGVRRLATLRRGRAQQAFFVRVADNRNVTVFLRHADDWAEFSPEGLDHQPLPPAGARTWNTRPSDDGTKLIYASELLPDGGVLQVGKANEELIDLLADYRRAAVIVMLIFVPASFAGGAFLASRALRPVQHLTEVAQEIVDTNRLDARVPSPGTGGELAALVLVFNKMLGRIDALVRGMRESLDNVAHDLRTPLTRLRHKAQRVIEVAEDSSSATLDSNHRQAIDALADCVEEADRVSTILNTLLDISEAEAGLVKLEFTNLSLASLIEQVVESYSEFAEERKVTVTHDVPEDIRVNADATSLFRVFANLLDNGIKYTPSGGNVRISAQRDGSQVTIRFKDTGIGIAPEDLPRVWERLFRASRSRTERGLGLGLSFVRAIIEAHGGTAAVESESGAGTAVKLTLTSA